MTVYWSMPGWDKLSPITTYCWVSNTQKSCSFRVSPRYFHFYLAQKNSSDLYSNSDVWWSDWIDSWCFQVHRFWWRWVYRSRRIVYFFERITGRVSGLKRFKKIASVHRYWPQRQNKLQLIYCNLYWLGYNPQWRLLAIRVQCIRLESWWNDTERIVSAYPKSLFKRL